MHIEMALKLGSYTFYLDHVKLFFGILFNLGCLMESLLHHPIGSTFIFVKIAQQKATNLALRQILAAGMG